MDLHQAYADSDSRTIYGVSCSLCYCCQWAFSYFCCGDVNWDLQIIEPLPNSLMLGNALISILSLLKAYRTKPAEVAMYKLTLWKLKDGIN